MNGIICLDKPQDFTSFDIVAISRKLCNTRKIGHTGTLDPMATGVLVLLVNRAAKVLQFLPSHNKSYSAIFKTGFDSDTGDIWGNVRQTGKVLSLDEVQARLNNGILASLTGDIMQLPPMYSAVKINGKKLYELAREGKTVDRQPRPVRVDSLTLTGINEQTGEFYLDCTCSAGTYIRTIITDIGNMLGCGAIMTGLRRTACCGYTLADCLTLEAAREYSDAGMLEQYIRPTDSIFLQSGAEKIRLSEKQTNMFINGVQLQLSRFPCEPLHDDIICVYSEGGRFIGLGRADMENDRLRPVYLDEV